MKASSIYVNLPVKDLDKTREFWSKLGFAFNERFSNDKGICMVLNEGSIYVMFLKRDFFETFTDRPAFDGSTTQTLNAIEVGSRENVDKLVGQALNMGAKRYREAQDHGWMYYDSFSDLDGHQWEIMYTDESKLPEDNT